LPHAVCYWHKADIAEPLINVRGHRAIKGRHPLPQWMW
jgi:hypothetical protein